MHSEPPKSLNLAALSLLVVDDNYHMCSILSAILKSVGVTKLREARDGAEALDILRQTPIDIAIIDFNMSPVDGLDFARMQRQATDSANRYLPIIMVSGHSERARVVEARDAGINEFIVKPMNAKALLDRITSVVMRPRPFVKCSTYFGPDRRRRADPQYSGPFRRAGEVRHDVDK